MPILSVTSMHRGARDQRWKHCFAQLPLELCLPLGLPSSLRIILLPPFLPLAPSPWQRPSLVPESGERHPVLLLGVG